MIKTEKKRKSIIKNANLRFAELTNCYETLLLIIDDINKELTNEYRLEKVEDEKGKRWKHNVLYYVDSRKIFTEEEQNEMKYQIYHYRYNTFIFRTLSEVLGPNGACNLVELIDGFYECVNFYYKRLLERGVDLEMWKQINDHLLVKYITDYDLKIKVLLSQGVLKERPKKENIIIEDLKPGKQLLLF